MAISLGYVSRKGHTLVDQRLFLPKDWTQEKVRLKKGVFPQSTEANEPLTSWPWRC